MARRTCSPSAHTVNVIIRQPTAPLSPTRPRSRIRSIAKLANHQRRRPYSDRVIATAGNEQAAALDGALDDLLDLSLVAERFACMLCASPTVRSQGASP
jgi:hypothetical protein